VINMSERITQTPSQTVGPFFYDALIRLSDRVLTNALTRGAHIVLSGVVRDGDGNPVPDAIVEIWQADAAGVYPHPADPRHATADADFRGYGRSDTTDGGRFEFHTVRPGRVDTNSAPHISVHVFARGMLIHAHTRIYFEGEAANASDPVLQHVPAARRGTLLAKAGGGGRYRFDIHLQGEHETVFFAP
jgi:protocatechuate 3,4-dioxygenase, alpha subunit